MLETKSIAALAFNETPRKRKRETPLKAAAGQSDAKQEAAAVVSCFTNAAFSSTPKKLIGRRRLAKENSNPFPCLEVKSIADLAHKQQPNTTTVNPYEVVRQPSKKKKREAACFENPGLNLELPEKQFNPYEVKRAEVEPSKGFVNEALNLRGQDIPASLNPFEIHRRSEISTLAGNAAGVENPALAEEPLPTKLKIGLPFAPTLNCRIDFHGMSLAQLTPSKMLAEKLVFSPVPAPKRSLGAISEETTMDIGKELDRYQLELENSINEAKLRKNGESVEVMVKQTTEIITETVVVQQEDVAYASASEEEEEATEELDFKAPPRFVRSYRPAALPVKAGSKDSLNSLASSKSSKSLEEKSTHGVKNLIRKSIRRLIHPLSSQETVEEEPVTEPAATQHHNLISSIRHSLRRRPQKPTNAEPEADSIPDISIIDSSERTMKLRSIIPQTEYMPIEQLTNEKKHTFRNSIRKSTREVLRHVFHKAQDGYATAK